MALFPASSRNRDGRQRAVLQVVPQGFKHWIDDLDIGRWVPHQARHTLATNLLRAGASLTHIRRYLGQVSERMAEHYVHLTHSDLEDVLQHVWVAGPGTANPGELLTGERTPLTREQAQALAIDLSRRSTPAEGGFCTFQPVVDGGACPWNLDCHNCDKFVLSGADLLYWRRKREQWRSSPNAPPTTPPPTTCTATSSPPPAPSTAWRKPWPASASSTRPSPWTCAGPRTTSTASGPPPSAPPTSPPPADQTADHETDRRGSLRMTHPPAPNPHRRSPCRPPPRHRGRAPRVHDAITRLRREKTPVSVAAVGRRAGVSRTFLYTNADAKTAVADAIREAGDQRGPLLAEADDSR